VALAVGEHRDHRQREQQGGGRQRGRVDDQESRHGGEGEAEAHRTLDDAAERDQG